MLRLLLMITFVTALTDAHPASANTNTNPNTNTGTPNTEKIGAIIFAHGYHSNAAGVMRNTSLARMADRLGVALIALDAEGADWALPNALHPANGRNVLSYVDNILADATGRFAIDPDRIMASGFSAGGMLIWTLACERADSFAGFAPMSGTCPGPAASVIHIHGDADKTVPLMGRAIGATHQGDVPSALEIYAKLGNFDAPVSEIKGSLRCETRRNTTNDILSYCEFSGGHSFRTQYLRQAWEMLAGAGQL